MALKPPRYPPKTSAEYDRWARETAVVADDGSINLGHLSSTLLDTNEFLVSRGSGPVSGPLIDADIPATLARDAEVTAAITAHELALDPHPVYQTQAESDARYSLLSNVLNGSATYDPPNLADAAGATTTVTVTGAVLGDYALAAFSLDLQGITVTAYVSAADTVTVRFQNESGSGLDLASGTLRARVWKQ